MAPDTDNAPSSSAATVATIRPYPVVWLRLAWRCAKYRALSGPASSDAATLPVTGIQHDAAD